MRIRFYFILVLTFFLVGSVNSRNWQFDYSPTRQNLARLTLLSDSLGFAVSYDGLLLKYNGREWRLLDSLSHFANQLLNTEDSLLLRYEKIGDIYTISAQDKNLSWLAVNNVSHHIYKIVRFDFKNNSFSAINLPVKIRSIDFWAGGYGIAVGQKGGYVFKNGLWLPLKLPVNVDFKSIKFVKKNSIFICGEQGLLLHGDGDNWQKLNTEVNVALRDMNFISADEGWIVGYNGVILHYIDGRLEQQIAETVNNLWAVAMISEHEGYAVGEKGTLLKYNGIYWDKIELNSDIDFHDIEMLNSRTGFIVGARGAILSFCKKGPRINRQHRFLFTDQVHLGSDYLMDRINDVYGVTVSEFNGDQLPDIYLTCYKSLNHLLINQGNGYFQDRVIGSGVGGNIETRVGKQKYEYGSLAADFDRDGDTDLLLAGKSNTTRYFINKGKASFSNFTESSGLPRNLEITDGALADFNEDGYPDFVLADENRGLRIFYNQKYNHFIETSTDSLHLPSSGLRAVKVSDINQDNHQDILAVYQNDPPVVLLNNRHKGWALTKESMFPQKTPAFVNSVSFCDVNNDGSNDLYFCTENGRDALYIFNKQKKIFEDQSKMWGIKNGGRSYSCVPADFNLDGLKDLYISRYGQDFLYLNKGNKLFIDVASDTIYSKAGYLSGYNTGAACADIDNNGTHDLIVGNTDFWSSLLQNLSFGKASLKIKLFTTQDTKEALGAKIWLWPAGQKHDAAHLIAYKEILPSVGLFSQNQTCHIFAAATGDYFDLRVRFLNGEEKNYRQLKKGTEIIVRQSGWFTEYLYKFGRTVLQFLHIPNMIWEILKLILFLLFVLASVRFIEHRYRWRPAHTALYVLLILSVYIALTLLMNHSGAFYHILPFAMVLFALLVLMAVNEPIRKTNLLHNLRQQKLHEAGTRLAASPEEQQAMQIVRDTLGFILSYRRFLVYTYHFNGNYFLFQDKVSKTPSAARPKIILEREIVDKLRLTKEPVTNNEFSFLWQDAQENLEDIMVFPLTRKNKLLGVILLEADGHDLGKDAALMETICYLFLQLSIALDNIRILRDLQEQEKIAAIGSFSGSIIHNLKNPIDGLRMIIEILKQETAENDPVNEYIEELYKGIRSLKQKLIHSFDFIHYAQSNMEKIMLNELISAIIRNYSDSQNTLFRLELTQDQLFLKGDREQLTFAFENIIQNAMEASSLSEPVVISTKRSSRNEMAEIKIADQGKGIASSEIASIFNLFYSTKGKNRGLGLTITRNIIRNHNGYIDVISEKDKGTCFRIFLPLM